jgi:hypothetical protein
MNNLTDTFLHPSAAIVTIIPIVNGYTVSSRWANDKVVTTYHANWFSIIKHIENVYVAVDKLILEERAKKK